MATGTFLRRTRLNSVRMRAPRMFRGVKVALIAITTPPVVEAWEVRSHAEAVFEVNKDGGTVFGVSENANTVWSVK